MKKALILLARLDEPIEEAQERAADPSLSIFERSQAEKEWRQLWLRRRLERLCVVLQQVGRFSVPAGVLVGVVWLRPDRSTFENASIASYMPMLICGLLFGALSVVALGLREGLRHAIAERYPSPDD